MECVRQLRAGESGEDERGCWSAGGHRRRHVAREGVWRWHEHIGVATHFRRDAPCGGACPRLLLLGEATRKVLAIEINSGRRAESRTRVPEPAAAWSPVRDPLRQRRRIHRSAAARRPAMRVLGRR